MSLIKFNDEFIIIDKDNDKNIYDLNVFTNENYYKRLESNILGIYYNNNYENNNTFNNILKDKIIKKIMKDYNKNLEELNINDNEEFIMINFIYNNHMININFNKKHKIFTSNIPINLINRCENIHIIEYLYTMNVYFTNKYKNLQIKLDILYLIVILQFLILFYK